jgi:hypothetical protein
MIGRDAIRAPRSVGTASSRARGWTSIQRANGSLWTRTSGSAIGLAPG